MDLRQLRAFVAVVDEGQFTRAADRLEVAQPAISAQVRQLERELGERLFHRHPQGASPTAAGAALLPHARDALAAAERARDTISSLRGLVQGRLRIGVSRPVDDRLASILGAFHRAHPAVDITLDEANNDALMSALVRGDLDAAVVGLASGAAPTSIGVRVMKVEPLTAAARPGRTIGTRRTVTLRTLRDTPLITLTRGSGLRSYLEDACRTAGFELRIAAETSDVSWLVALARAGLGVAVAPRSIFAGSDLATAEITRPRHSRRTVLAWNTRAASPAARAFHTLATATLDRPVLGARADGR